MIATANYNEGGTTSTADYDGSTTTYLTSFPMYSYSEPICPDCFDSPINLLHEDKFFEEICKKSIRMESKRFIPPPVTNINRGRG